MTTLERVWPPPIFVFELAETDFAHIFIFTCQRLIDLRVIDPDGLIKLKTYFEAQLFRVREPLLINFVLTPFKVSQNSQDMVRRV